MKPLRNVVIVILFLVSWGWTRAHACSGSQTPSMKIQNVLDSYPAGTTFCFQPGVYRIATPLNPKNN